MEVFGGRGSGEMSNDVIKVFVATQEQQMLSFKVLEYSIKQHCSVPVEVYPLHKIGIDCPVPVNPANRQRTPFSFQRFMIPEAVGYSGRAIYMDSDMQVFSDLAEIWNTDMEGNCLLYCAARHGEVRSEQFSVLLLDCERLDWKLSNIVADLDTGRFDYRGLMGDMCVAESKAPLLPCYWNSLEFYSEKETALVHYTDMQTQPWVNVRNPLSSLWFESLFEAVESGAITLGFIDKHIAEGWVRPSVRYQVDSSVADSRNLPAVELAKDREFVPPYKSIRVKRSVKSLLSYSENIKRLLRFYRKFFC